MINNERYCHHGEGATCYARQMWDDTTTSKQRIAYLTGIDESTIDRLGGIPNEPLPEACTDPDTAALPLYDRESYDAGKAAGNEQGYNRAIRTIVQYLRDGKRIGGKKETQLLANIIADEIENGIITDGDT
jgi:hypothetical protein